MIQSREFAATITTSKGWLNMSIDEPVSPRPESMRAILELHRELFNARDRDGWLALFAEEPTVEEPVGTGVRTGKRHFAENMSNLERAGIFIPEFDTTIVCGNEVAVS